MTTSTQLTVENFSGVASSRLVVVHLLFKVVRGFLPLYLINAKIIPTNIAVVTTYYY